jgi:hypothetical protein
MFKIIRKEELENLRDTRAKYKQLWIRVDQMYWFYEFSFMENLTKWLKTGYSSCGGFYNVPASKVRDRLREDVNEFFNQEISALRQENKDLSGENVQLRNAIKALRRLDKEIGEENESKSG